MLCYIICQMQCVCNVCEIHIYITCVYLIYSSFPPSLPLLGPPNSIEVTTVSGSTTLLSNQIIYVTGVTVCIKDALGNVVDVNTDQQITVNITTEMTVQGMCVHVCMWNI